MVSDQQRYYNPSRRLADYDGVPIRSAHLPGPGLLSKWHRAGLIRFDVDTDRLVLTEEGRRVAREEDGEGERS